LILADDSLAELEEMSKKVQELVDKITDLLQHGAHCQRDNLGRVLGCTNGRNKDVNAALRWMRKWVPNLHIKHFKDENGTKHQFCCVHWTD